MVSKNYKTFSTQFLFHLLIALPINLLHHPLPGNQTKTSITFGCGYLMLQGPRASLLHVTATGPALHTLYNLHF
jgi:hypothetical protein